MRVRKQDVDPQVLDDMMRRYNLTEAEVLALGQKVVDPYYKPEPEKNRGTISKKQRYT